MGVTIHSTSGYMRLDSWVMAYIIQLGTMEFCQRFVPFQVDPKGRWLDQMTQAARSATANIAEGSARHQTSRETEMKLIDVARASLNELAGDYMFWLSMNGQACWSRHDARYHDVRLMRLDSPHYDDDELIQHEAMLHAMNQKKRFDLWLKSDDGFVCANTLLVLCWRLIKMLDNQLASLLGQFKEEGGFTENMTQERLATIKEKAQATDNPRCPKCGAEMRRQMAKKGRNAGNEFWGCINYPNCNGTLPIVPGNMKQTMARQ